MQRAANDAKPHTLSDQFAASGIAVIEHALPPDDIERIDAAFPALGEKTAGAHADAFTAEARGWFATHGGLLDVAGRLLQAEARLSRLQAFDKSPTANWFVPWHQDRAEDGRERDVGQLERTVALRIHLDDCDESNGPLDVIPGSHVHGRLTAAAIQDIVTKAPSLVCLAVRGDIVAMRPLLLHRSQRAQRPAARRVVHIEFTAARWGSMS